MKTLHISLLSALLIACIGITTHVNAKETTIKFFKKFGPEVIVEFKGIVKGEKGSFELLPDFVTDEYVQFTIDPEQYQSLKVLTSAKGKKHTSFLHAKKIKNRYDIVRGGRGEPMVKQ